MVTNPTVTRKELSEMFDVNDSLIKRRIENMVKRNLIKRVGPNKGGYWEVIKNV